MTSQKAHPLLSVVVPLYNEAAGLKNFHASLLDTLSRVETVDYEVLYVDDGSTDDGRAIVRQLNADDPRIKLISFSRNFGKESALSAGITEAKGDAILTLDGDGQHPVELIPSFVEAWQSGAQVVVGVSVNRRSPGMIKHIGSRIFYRTFNSLTGQKLVAGTSDFRLISQAVRDEFVRLGESERITRGLIDWLGFKRTYVEYSEKPRMAGEATYDTKALVKLATNSFVSMSPKPLYLFGYLGVLITCASFVLGSAVFIEQLVMNDPLNWNFTGTAMLGILVLFLVGIVLMSQGILSLYISHIHTQAKQRPLYVIDRESSAGLNNSGHENR